MVHQNPQPRLDALHDIQQEVLLHLRAVVEGEVPHMNGPPHHLESHKLGEVALVLRLLVSMWTHREKVRK